MRGSEGREAVQDCGPDLELCPLPVEVTCQDALAGRLEAAHFPLNRASSVVAAPAAPDRAAEAAGGAEDFVPGLCAEGVFHPRPRVLARRDDGAGVPCSDGGGAAPRVLRAVCADLANRLAGGDLVQQFGQHRRISDAAAGDVNRSDLQRVSIDAKMHLAPLPGLGLGLA